MHLRPIVKTMHPREIAFRDQIRLRLQPMLHLVTKLRTFIFIDKISSSGHFIR